MPYLNSRLHALVAMSLLLLTAPSLLAQDETSVVSTEIRGDVNGDGRVTAADAEAVRAYLVRGTVPAGRDIMSGDANADGRVTAADAALISRFAAGVDVSRFPVGRRMDDTGETTDITRMRLALFACSTSVETGVTSCRPTGGSETASLDIIVGDEVVDVDFTNVSVSNGNPANPDTTTLTWTLTNRMDQPIGTTDGINPSPVGSRLFFYSNPAPTSLKPGSREAKHYPVTPIGALTATFTSAQGTSWTNRKYYQFDGVLQKDSSASRQVGFVYHSNVLAFSYGLLLATPVPFDRGRVILTPPVDSVIAPDSSITIVGKAVNHRAQDTTDVLDWTSSNPSVATVNSAGVVTAVAEGTTTIKATDITTATRTPDSLTIVVDRFPEVASTDPADGDVNISPDTTITVTFTEPVNVTTSSFDLECPSGGAALPYTIGGDGTATITLTPDADLPSGTVCEVTVKGNQVQDVDTNDGPNFMPGQYVFDFEIGIQAVADSLTSTTTGNVRINTASTSPVFSVITNDKIGPATTITFAGWSGTPGKTQQGGDVVMTMSDAGMGRFTYNPPAGYTGVDSLEYTIASGSATSSARVALPVSGMIWFVNNAGAACTTRASGCGRLTNPYSTLAAFHAENNGAGNNPAAGDNVFLYESAAAYTGPVALLAQQKLIGQDAGAGLPAITGITPATGSDPLPGMNPGANTVTINGASGGVVLADIDASSGANNTVRGLSIATSGGAGLSGTDFGSPVIEEVPISVTGGPSLSLSGGTVNSTFATASSANSTGAGLSLTNVSGSITFGSGTSLTNSNGTGFSVSGAAPTITYSGGISKNAAIPGRLVEINNVTGGTITFNTGTLSSTSTAGTGIQLSNADGAVNFNGTVTLTGGDNGVDIIAGSSGAIDFDAATITNPSGEALRIFNGSGGDQAANVTFDGAIATNAGRPVLIEDVSSGTVAMNASINASAGLGILVQNNTGGTFTFSHATQSLNTGANAAVSLLNNTGATANFTGGSLVISTAAGAGFNASGGGTVNVTGAANTVASGTGTAVTIANTSIGGSGVTFRTVSASGAANGIVLNTTGAGAFTLAGNGGSCTVATPTCTGGLIFGTTGAGVSLNATGAVSLTRLRVQSAQSHGITASGSTNLTLTSSYLQSNGNGDEENGLNLLNAAGTVLVDASSFNGAAENLIRVDNNNANLTFTVQNASSFEFPNPEPSAFRNSGILITPKGSSMITATVTGNTFRNIPVSSFQAAPDASVTSTSTYTFTNNTLSADAGLNVTCASNSQCRVGNVVAGGTGGVTNFIATGNNFNRVNGDGVFILGANQSSTLRLRVDNNTIANAMDDAFVVGLGQSARVIAQFNGNSISNIGADVLEVASGEVNAGFGAGSASDMDLVFTNNSMNTVGTNSSLAATGGPGVFRFGDSDQLLCLAFTGNSMSGPLPTTGLKVYLDGNFGALGGSMTYEGAGAGALTDAKIQADNPGMALAPANTVISAVNLSNGATCQRPGI